MPDVSTEGGPVRQHGAAGDTPPGLPEFWLLDIEERAVEVWRSGAGRPELVDDVLTRQVGATSFELPLARRSSEGFRSACFGRDSRRLGGPTGGASAHHHRQHLARRQRAPGRQELLELLRWDRRS